MNMLAQRIIAIPPPKVRKKQKLRSRLANREPMVRPKAGHIGEILVRMGCLKTEDIGRILAEQQRSGQRFGRTAIKMRLVKPEHVNAAMGVQLGLLRETNPPVPVPKDLAVIRKRRSAETKKLQQIAAQLITSTDSDLLKSVSMISTASRDKSVFVEANLAAAFAQMGKKVLMIDADFQLQKLGSFFGVSSGSGLSDYLVSQTALADVVVETVVKNLSILPAGAAPHNAQELLGSSQFHGLLEQAEEDYEVVIVTTAPYGATADSQLVWAATKAAFVTARRDITRIDDLKQLNSVLRKLEVEIIGAVMAV